MLPLLYTIIIVICVIAFHVSQFLITQEHLVEKFMYECLKWIWLMSATKSIHYCFEVYLKWWFYDN